MKPSTVLLACFVATFSTSSNGDSKTKDAEVQSGFDQSSLLDSLLLANPGGPFHGDEVKATSGSGWFGLYQSGSGFELRKVTIKVALVEDPVVDDQTNQKTGKLISVTPESKDKAVILIKPKNPSSLNEGKIEGKLFEQGTTIFPGQSQTAKVGQNYYSLIGSGEAVLHPSAHEPLIKNYALHLFFDQQSRLLFSEKEPLSQDGRPQVIWVGDLDRDGKLDLLLNLTTHYNSSRLALFLSSAAQPGRLVEMVAELSVTGC